MSLPQLLLRHWQCDDQFVPGAKGKTLSVHVFSALYSAELGKGRAGKRNTVAGVVVMSLNPEIQTLGGFSVGRSYFSYFSRSFVGPEVSHGVLHDVLSGATSQHHNVKT